MQRARVKYRKMDQTFIRDELLDAYFSLADGAMCLCGSGRRFADCHRLPDHAVALEDYEIYKGLAYNVKKRTCHFSDKTCSKNKIKSHSIPRVSLKSIAVEGHVSRLSFPRNRNTLDTLREELTIPSDIEVNRAGIYGGFCSRHDNDLFKPIVSEVVKPTQEQAALLLYRALTWELYTKDQTKKFAELGTKIAASKHSSRDRHLLNVANMQFFMGTHKSILETTTEHDTIAADIRNHRFEAYRFITWKFSCQLPVNAGSYINPAYDLECNLYQDYNDLSAKMSNFALLAFSPNGTGIVVIPWRQPDDFDGFFAPFLEMPNKTAGNYLVQLVFSTSENHVFLRAWWSGLSTVKQNRLQRLFRANSDPQWAECFASEFRRHDFGVGAVEERITSKSGAA
jgi:hypothetical protein